MGKELCRYEIIELCRWVARNTLEKGKAPTFDEIAKHPYAKRLDRKVNVLHIIEQHEIDIASFFKVNNYNEETDKEIVEFYTHEEWVANNYLELWDIGYINKEQYDLIVEELEE